MERTGGDPDRGIEQVFHSQPGGRPRAASAKWCRLGTPLPGSRRRPEHRRGAGDREELHQAGAKAGMAFAQRGAQAYPRPRPGVGAGGVVQLDDGADQARSRPRS